MRDEHAPGRVRLNAIYELANLGYGRPPKQPIEGLTPPMPENPTEDEIIAEVRRRGLSSLVASWDIETTTATRPEGQHRSRRRDARNRDGNKNTKRSTAK
jgi:hypothetical protein